VIVLIAAVAAAVGVGWYEIRRGFSARGTPSAIETFVATTARRLAVPSDYRPLRNPLPASPQNIRAGMEHFADHCSACHANDGSGDTMFGKGLYPKPPDLRTSGTQEQSDGELYYAIENGVRLSGMPAFGGEQGTHDADTWKLVVFIRHLPRLTSEEARDMERFNPKSEADREEELQEEQFLKGGNSPEEDTHEKHQTRRTK
jgi:mono/diheme cytochrome c family protein